MKPFTEPNRILEKNTVKNWSRSNLRPYKIGSQRGISMILKPLVRQRKRLFQNHWPLCWTNGQHHVLPHPGLGVNLEFEAERSQQQWGGSPFGSGSHKVGEVGFSPQTKREEDVSLLPSQATRGIIWILCPWCSGETWTGRCCRRSWKRPRVWSLGLGLFTDSNIYTSAGN